MEYLLKPYMFSKKSLSHTASSLAVVLFFLFLSLFLLAKIVFLVLIPFSVGPTRPLQSLSLTMDNTGSDFLLFCGTVGE